MGFGIRDQRSGIIKNLFRIPDLGPRGQKGAGSLIPVPQFFCVDGTVQNHFSFCQALRSVSVVEDQNSCPELGVFYIANLRTRLIGKVPYIDRPNV
jgi:hypothetical protein